MYMEYDGSAKRHIVEDASWQIRTAFAWIAEK